MKLFFKKLSQHYFQLTKKLTKRLFFRFLKLKWEN